jgi:hypothetical protein
VRNIIRRQASEQLRVTIEAAFWISLRVHEFWHGAAAKDIASVFWPVRIRFGDTALANFPRVYRLPESGSPMFLIRGFSAPSFPKRERQ